jgi:hypothetical protein
MSQPVLTRKRRFDRLLALPCPGGVTQIAPLSRRASHATPVPQCLDGRFIQALALGARALAEGGVDGRRYATDGVLHPSIIGSASIVSKQIESRFVVDARRNGTRRSRAA